MTIYVARVKRILELGVLQWWLRKLIQEEGRNLKEVKSQTESNWKKWHGNSQGSLACMVGRSADESWSEEG